MENPTQVKLPPEQNQAIINYLLQIGFEPPGYEICQVCKIVKGELHYQKSEKK